MQWQPQQVHQFKTASPSITATVTVKVYPIDWFGYSSFQTLEPLARGQRGILACHLTIGNRDFLHLIFHSASIHLAAHASSPVAA